MRLRCSLTPRPVAQSLEEQQRFTAKSLAALEAKVMEALQCDCVADLRDGVCGTPFTTGVVDRAQRRRRCLSSLTPAYPLFP